MKKTISFLLLTAMLLSLFPLGALAETLDYEVVDYSTTLTIGTEYIDYVDENDPMVKLNGSTYYGYVENYMGYSQGYNVYLEEDKLYRFTVMVDGVDAEYVDFGIALLDNSFLSYMTYDVYKTVNVSVVDSWAEITMDFVCQTSDDYNFLVSSILVDKNGYEIFGEEKTTTYINIEKLASYNEVDYYTTLELDSMLDTSIKSTGFEVYSSVADEVGFAKGYSVSLKKGYYDLDIVLEEGDKEKSDVFFMVYKDELSGTEEDDIIAMPSEQSFYIDSDGDYKIFLLCNLIRDEDYNDIIDADGTTVKLTLKETVFEPIYCYRKADIIELKNMLEQVKTNTNTVKVIIADDIDMTGYDWKSIDVNYDYASVIVEGNGHTIKGLSDGLFANAYNIFGVYDLTVDVDVNIEDKTLSLNDYGGLIGYFYGTLIAENVAVTGKMNIVANTIEDFGGFVGDINGSMLYIDGCSTELDIDLSGEGEVCYSGGFIGYTYGREFVSSIQNSFANCDINIKSVENSSYYIGGFVGCSEERVYFNCYSDGTLTFNENTEYNHSEIGGFSGWVYDDVYVNCYSSVDINATETSEAVGGFVGDASNVVILNCYSEGTISGGLYVGGIVGDSNVLILFNSYTTSDVSAVEYVGGLVGYTDSYVFATNVYTSGKVSLVPSDVDFALAASLIGYVDSYDYLSIDNLFTYTPNMGTFISSSSDGAETVAEAVTVVDFTNDDEVDAMTELLNASAEEMNKTIRPLLADVPFDLSLSSWEGRNTDNGPMLSVFLKPEEPENPENPENPTDPEYILGDVNNDGKVDADDYILLKRVYFGSAKLENLDTPETALARSDVFGADGKITGDDYILLKRVYFGMAKL